MAKAKKLKLKPSARDKRRYFLTNSNDKTKIEKAILEYIGILGVAKSAFMFVDIIEKDSKLQKNLVCSCLRESLEDIRASLAFKKIKIQKVSGTLDGLER